jgi:hypothetical protein
MASNGSDMVWVTDFSAKKIHAISVADLNNPIVTTLVSNTISTPNGIVFDPINNRLVFVSWGGNAPIKSVDPATGAVATLTATTLGNCDGIDRDANGNFFVASWSPNRITQYNADFSVAQTISVAGGLSSPADICYAIENDTLAIPNSGNNTVVYVGFDNVPNHVSEIEQNNWNLLQNQDQWEIQWAGDQSEIFDITVFSISGQMMMQEKWFVDHGKNRFIIPHQNWSEGAYFVSCRNANGGHDFKVIK